MFSTLAAAIPATAWNLAISVSSCCWAVALSRGRADSKLSTRHTAVFISLTSCRILTPPSNNLTSP